MYFALLVTSHATIKFVAREDMGLLDGVARIGALSSPRAKGDRSICASLNLRSQPDLFDWRSSPASLRSNSERRASSGAADAVSFRNSVPMAEIAVLRNF